MGIGNNNIFMFRDLSHLASSSSRWQKNMYISKALKAEAVVRHMLERSHVAALFLIYCRTHILQHKCSVDLQSCFWYDMFQQIKSNRTVTCQTAGNAKGVTRAAGESCAQHREVIEWVGRLYGTLQCHDDKHLAGGSSPLVAVGLVLVFVWTNTCRWWHPIARTWRR